MADRLEQIKDRITKGYTNWHRWQEPNAHSLAAAEQDIEWLLDEVDRLRSGIALHRQTGLIARGPKDVPRYVRDLWALIDPEDS